MTTDAGIARNTVAHCKTTRPTQSRFNSTKTAMDLYKIFEPAGSSSMARQPGERTSWRMAGER